MARPINADAQATRAAVLTAAGRLFSAQGAGQTSVRAIAKEAGVSLALVHHYFGSKAQLYDCCIDAMYVELADVRAELEVAFFSDGSLSNTMDRAVRTMFRFARKHQAANRLVVRDILDSGEMKPERREKYLLPFLDMGSALLASRLGKPRRDMRLLLSSINHVIVRYAVTANSELMLVADADSPEAAAAYVEDYLVSLALRMTGLTATESH